MNMNREVIYNWKSQILLLIGALLINLMLVSVAKADNTKAESVGSYPPVKERHIEKHEQFLTDFAAKKLEEAKIAGPKKSDEYASRNDVLEDLLRSYKEANRRALDNPTKENILAEIRAEEEYRKRLKVAALSPEIDKIIEELNELSRRLNEYRLSGSA